MFLDTNYSGLNKFSREDNDNFKLVLPKIRRIVKDRPLIVAKRYCLKSKNTKYVFRLVLTNVFTIDTTSTLYSNVYYKVPYTINRLFIRRTKLLAQIIETLYSNRPFYTNR